MFSFGELVWICPGICEIVLDFAWNFTGNCFDVSWNLIGCQLNVFGFCRDLFGTVLEIAGSVDNKTKPIKGKHPDSQSAAPFDSPRTKEGPYQTSMTRGF